MTFLAATLFVVIISIALIYKVTDRFGFRLKLSSIALCAVLAVAVNFAAIMMSPYLTEEHFIRLGVLVVMAAAAVTVYNEYLLRRDARLAAAEVSTLPLTEAEMGMAEADGEVLATPNDEKEPAFAAAIEPVGAIEPAERAEGELTFAEKLRKKAMERREKIIKLQEEKERLDEMKRLDELAKAREEEKAKEELAEKKRRQEEEKAAAEREKKRQEEQAAREKREREEQARRDQEEKARREREKIERAEQERREREERAEQERREQEERAEQERRQREEREKKAAEEQAKRERAAKVAEEEKLRAERSASMATAKVRRQKTLDELLDEALSAKAQNDKSGAITALGQALRLYAEDDYAPFVAIDLANVFKDNGDYLSAAGVHVKALNLPSVRDNPDMRREFENSITYLRRLNEVLNKHNMRGKPYGEIPAAILREAEGAK